MAKLTDIRASVLHELQRRGGGQSANIARRLGCAQTSVQSALRFLRDQGLAEFVGFWRITDAGREALKAEDGRHG